MARLPRLVLAGVPLHITQRGNNRTAVFFQAEDYRRYREMLLWASRRHGCAVHAYVLMTNHVHLLLTPRSPSGPARMMQALGGSYVPYFNERYGRTGTLWEGRYSSAIVQSDRYLLAGTRYIELNPVRARIVEEPARYPWSSYHHNATGKGDPLITEHPLYRSLGSTAAERLSAYLALAGQALRAPLVSAIRKATRQGTVLGTRRFLRRIGVGAHRVPLPRHGGDRRSDQFHSKFQVL